MQGDKGEFHAECTDDQLYEIGLPKGNQSRRRETAYGT
jgi:hypothetical protein